MGIPILVEALRDLDEDLIEDAIYYNPKKERKKMICKILCGVAACVALVSVVVLWHECSKDK